MVTELFAVTGCSTQEWTIFKDDATGKEFWCRRERGDRGLPTRLIVEINADHRRTGRVWYWSSMGAKWVLSNHANANHYFKYHGFPVFK